MSHSPGTAPVVIGRADVVREAVRVSGEIDMSNVAQLATAMDKAARRSPDGFVVDLTETVYLDSSALGVFWRFVRATAAPTFLVVPGSICERALYMVGLQDAVVAA
ncbi:MAG: STAS domain-containing protein [Sporichthyaceae bacterium]